MDRNRIKSVLLGALFALIVVGLMTFVTYKVAVEPAKQQIATLSEEVKTLQYITEKNTTLIKQYSEIIEKVGERGPKGDKGDKGDRGEPGRDGVTTTIIKEIPSLIQINPITGDLETKLETDSIWQVIAPCNILLVSCPPLPILVNTGEGV